MSEHSTAALAERLASELISKCDVRTLPVDVEQLCQRLGVARRYHHDERFEGRFEQTSTGPEITLSEAQYYRSRFTLAHELGHYLVDTEKDRNSRLARLDAAGSREIEKLCDHFAGSLLLPAHTLKCVVDYKEEITTGLLRKMSGRAQVSWSSFAVRLSQLGRQVRYVRFSPNPSDPTDYWVASMVGLPSALRRWLRVSPDSARQLGSLPVGEEHCLSIDLAIARSDDFKTLSLQVIRTADDINLAVDSRNPTSGAWIRLGSAAVRHDNRLRSRQAVRRPSPRGPARASYR